MKRKIYLVMLMVLSFSVFGCGEKTKETTSTPSLESNQGVTDEEDSLNVDESSQNATEINEEPSENTEVSGDSTGVYPNSTEIVEINMGITDDILTFKVPTDYVLAGVYYDENMQKQAMKGLSSATTTVKEAMAAGSFSTDKHMAEFSMTSLQADETMVSAKLYPKDRTPWEKFKEHFTDAKEIGDANLPGLVYHTQTGSGTNLAVAIKVNEESTLEIVYVGSLESEIGEDELAQRLYDLVTIKS